MAGERYRILFLTTTPKSGKFISTQGGGGSAELPVRIRAEHAGQIIARFEESWAQKPERSAVGIPVREGTYLEFISTPDFELKLASLEDLRKGMRLMNVRSVERNGQEQQLATVYVPDAAKAMFLSKLTAYAEENTPRGSPKNRALVESIDDVRRAMVESFWTETDKNVEPPKETKQWVEVWLNTETDDEIGRFRNTLQALHVQEHESERIIRFPERTVIVTHANGKDLASLIEHSDQIAEFRAAHEPATPIASASNKEQTEWVDDLVARCKYPNDERVVVCLLDTGVNNGHVLLAPLLTAADLHAFDPNWSKNDMDGHGTLMAGIAAYGDLQEVISHGLPVELSHRLESSKILPDQGNTPESSMGRLPLKLSMLRRS